MKRGVTNAPFLFLLWILEIFTALLTTGVATRITNKKAQHYQCWAFGYRSGGAVVGLIAEPL